MEKILDIESASHEELIVEAKRVKLSGGLNLTESAMRDAIRVYRFIKDPANQAQAISKAVEMKARSEGKWFTLREMRESSRHISKTGNKIVKGAYGETILQVEQALLSLSLFDMVRRKLRTGKQTKYKIRLEVAHKAIEAHNKNVKATKIIEGK